MNTQTTVQSSVVNFTINGIALSVPKGTTVYNAAKQAGIDIPIFCYQDRMPPFGACRMCLVEVEKMPKLQTACTLEAAEGMSVKTQTAMAVEGRQGILEFLLLNHPLDCPICDRGGECPLQDQTVKYGPGMSRFFEEKRHFKKPIPLGPVLMLDRERCIVCARCTRFGDVIAGDHALEFIERGYKTEVGTPDGRPVDSKFIGNTITICPVGALTSQVYRFRARPWDNQSADSTCTLCPVGCSMILDSRDGEIMRTRAKEDSEVNDMWLCDKGWFGYEFASHADRLKTPLIRRGGELVPSSWDESLSFIAKKFKEAKPRGKMAAFGGNPLTVEENYLLQKFMREGAGVPHVDHRIGTPILSLDDEAAAPGMETSIGECEQLSFAILCGIDLTEEFPVIWLRLRQAINKGAKVIFIGHYAPEISKYFMKTIVHPPGEELDALKKHLSEIDALSGNEKKGAIFVGAHYLASPNRKEILSLLLNRGLALNILEGRGNSLGARFAGMRPDIGPLGQPVNPPGLNALQVLEKGYETGWDFLYSVGADPASKFPAKLWQRFRSKLGCLIVQDIFLTETAKQADVVLPALAFTEKGGHFINIEQRVRKLHPGKAMPHGIYSDAKIFSLLAHKLHFALELDSHFYDRLQPGRISFTQVERIDSHPVGNSEKKGEFFATFAPALFDNGVRMKHNSHVVQLAKEPLVRIHPLEGAKRKIQSGDEIYLRANGAEIIAKVKLDASVSERTVVLPLGFPQVPVQELSPNLINGFPVEVSQRIHTERG